MVDFRYTAGMRGKGSGRRYAGSNAALPAEGSRAAKLRRIFHVLRGAMGPQNWWPAGSAFEVVAGAYLTQNTAWGNVEQAMGNLRAAGVLSVSGIRGIAL